ncbi:hypothetical protein CN316_22145 [Bacillus cereus]|nr:hypothetical protein CN316_22145 [Bacillus cereus]
MLIYLKKNYKISGWFETEPGKESFSFDVPMNEHNYEVEINNAQQGLCINTKFEIDTEVSELLEESMSGKLKIQINEKSGLMHSVALYMIGLMKYSLNLHTIEENLIEVDSIFISADNEKWNKISTQVNLVSGSSYSPRVFTNEAAKVLQEYISNQFEPFIALKHLHRARADSNPRHMWIEATIAAELAIKEFLIRKNRNLEFLLLELPSPSLSLLYGRVLEKYAGEKYPKYNKLGEGAQMRNKLVHRPEEARITYEQAVSYIMLVEDAIYYLLRSLYPADPLMTPPLRAAIQITKQEV